MIMKCNREVVIDVFKSNGINVISCFPVLKQYNDKGEKIAKNDDDESTLFRVCVNDADAHKMKDSNIIISNIVVREWRFKKKDD